MERRNASGRWPRTSWPRTNTSPAVASSSRLMSRKGVALPQPLGPSKATMRPETTVKETWSTALTPPANFLLTLRSSSATGSLILRAAREIGHAEVGALIRPGSRQHESGVPGQVDKSAETVFIGAFGADGFTRGEKELLIPQVDPLRAPAVQVHFDAPS